MIVRQGEVEAYTGRILAHAQQQAAVLVGEASQRAAHTVAEARALAPAVWAARRDEQRRVLAALIDAVQDQLDGERAQVVARLAEMERALLTQLEALDQRLDAIAAGRIRERPRIEPAPVGESPPFAALRRVLAAERIA